MLKMNIKKGDTVVVISGKDKGKTGKVLQVVAIANRALVDGINIITKHQKPRNQKESGGIFKRPAPVQISNLMVICPVCGKATRVGRKVVDGKNARICKKCGASLDKAFVKAVKKDAKKTEKVEEKVAQEEKATETKTAVKKTTAPKTTKKTATTKTAVKTTKAKASSTTARKSSNRGV